MNKQSKSTDLILTISGVFCLALLAITSSFAAGSAARNVTFTDTEQLIGGGNTQKVLYADFDKDGDQDIVFINRGVTPDSVWLNNGAAAFTRTQTLLAHQGGDGQGGAIGDVNGDGNLDLVAVGGGNNYIAIGSADGTFVTTQRLFSTSETQVADVALGDLDGDGDLDLFVARSDGGNWVYRNDGSGGFSDTGQTLGSAWTNGVSLGDFDGDGDLDAATANGISSFAENKIWRNDGAGNFSDGGVTADRWAYGVISADFDNDNDLDLAFAYWTAPSVIYLNDGSGSFSDSGQTLGSGGNLGVAASDVDGDGDSDLFIAAGVNGGRLYRNDGSGSFTAQQTLPPPNNDAIQSATFADFDDDGNPDLALGNFFRNTVWLNGGADPATPTPLPTQVAQPLIRRVSINDAGVQANGASSAPAISGDGRYVVFSSSASNLSNSFFPDTNNRSDIFIHDNQSGVTERVSVGTGRTEANGSSFQPDVSADGRYIVFQSNATNLTAFADVSARFQIYLHDRQIRLTTLISKGPVFVGNFDSERPRFSADDSTIVYESSANQLVSGDDNAQRDIFAYDIASGITERISVDDDGNSLSVGFSSEPTFLDSGAANVSADGNLVVFVATNPSDNVNIFRDSFIYLRDRINGTTRRLDIPEPADSSEQDVVISDNGQAIALTLVYDAQAAGDRNSKADIYSINWASDPITYTRRSDAADGSQSNGNALTPALDATGQTLAFSSFADNLDSNPVALQEIFVRDLASGDLVRVSVNAAGGVAAGRSKQPELSADGRYVVFASTGQLTLNDSNDVSDIYIYDRLGMAEDVSFPPAPDPGDLPAPVLGICDCPLAQLYAPALCDSRTAAAAQDELIAGKTGLLTYYAVRDKVLAPSAMGQLVIDDYYAHAPEVTQLLLTNPLLAVNAARVVLDWQPLLHELVSEGGQPVTVIEPEHVETVERFLDNLMLAGSAELQTMLARQRSNLGDLNQYVGATVTEASNMALGSTLYIPLIIDSPQ